MQVLETEIVSLVNQHPEGISNIKLAQIFFPNKKLKQGIESIDKHGCDLCGRRDDLERYPIRLKRTNRQYNAEFNVEERIYSPCKS